MEKASVVSWVPSPSEADVDHDHDHDRPHHRRSTKKQSVATAPEVSGGCYCGNDLEREARIAARRERIAAKTAAEIEPDEGDKESLASSIELLTAHRHDDAQFQTKPTRGLRRSTAIGPPVSASTASMQARAAAMDSSSAGLIVKESLEQQLEQSRKQLEELLLDGETLVTNVKVAAEYRERTRQDTVKQTKKERLAKLKQEAEESEAAFKAMEAEWEVKAGGVLPLELYEKIQTQQRSSDKLLDRKQELLDDLAEEMETNDVDYEADLGIYQNDLILMGDRIDDHIDTLRAAFMEELKLIEEFTAHDRQVMLEQNQKEWMDMLEKFENLDKNATTDRQQGALDRFTKLGELYSSTREANKVKEALKDDFRTLQLELEHIKMATLINLEKLEYNSEVLRRREVENMAMKNSLKRLLLKTQDKFNTKVHEYERLVAKAHRDSDRIIREIHRLQQVNAEAGKKLVHLLALDWHTYMDLWTFSEEEAREKLTQLHQSEKLVFETQFGLKPTDPDIKALDDRPAEVQKFIEQQHKCEKSQTKDEPQPPAKAKETQTEPPTETTETEPRVVDTNARLERFPFPSKNDISEYWDRFLLLLDPRHVDWQAIMCCFAQFNKLLKVRNQYEEDIRSLYRENMELSFLLKKNLQGNGRGRQCGIGRQVANEPSYC